jgi:hypothetical protein
MAKEQWFYSTGGSQAGPVSPEELKALAATGQLKPADLIWRDGLADWSPASTAVPELFSVPAPAPVAAPVPEPVMAVAVAPQGVLPYQGGGVAISVSSRTMELLRQTRPWVLFIGIIGFIVAGLIALATGMFIYFTAGSMPSGRIEPLLIMGIYVLMGVACFLPSLYLCRFAMSIHRLQVSGSVDELERALAVQKSFWRLTGMLVITVIVAYVLLIAFFIAAMP